MNTLLPPPRQMNLKFLGTKYSVKIKSENKSQFLWVEACLLAGLEGHRLCENTHFDGCVKLQGATYDHLCDVNYITIEIIE